MKITLVNASMTCGGAERVMSIMANHWARRGHSVTLITIDSVSSDFFALDSNITRIGLGLIIKSKTLWTAVKNNFVRFRKLREVIRKAEPEVIISFLQNTNVMTLLATRGLSIPVVVSERSNPEQQCKGYAWNQLRRRLYRRANAVVVQTNAIRDWMAEIVPPRRVHVIPNPVPPVFDARGDRNCVQLPQPFVVGMGRLVEQKGFDLLLKAFALCRCDSWSLVILGEGPEKQTLERLTDRLGMSSKIHFLGRVDAPHVILKQAAMFVMSSHTEGFPNALTEAMSCGLPVISFDCPMGPGIIIKHGDNGLLIPAGDVDELANSMNLLMNNESERRRLGAEALKVGETFSLERVMFSWETLMAEVQGKKRGYEVAVYEK